MKNLLLFLLLPIFGFNQTTYKKIDIKIIPTTYLPKYEDTKEDSEKYQMIYYSKNVVERETHAKWFYASYDMTYGEEIGFGVYIYLNQRRKYYKKKLNYFDNYE